MRPAIKYFVARCLRICTVGVGVGCQGGAIPCSLWPAPSRGAAWRLLDLAIGLANAYPLHETGVVEGPFYSHVIDAKKSRNSLETHLGMGFFGGQAASQMSDMHGRIEQVERDIAIFAGRLCLHRPSQPLPGWQGAER